MLFLIVWPSSLFIFCSFFLKRFIDFACFGVELFLCLREEDMHCVLGRFLISIIHALGNL